MILHKGLAFINDPGQAGSIAWTPARSFTGCFVLTMSSPLTIVFWSSIFSAKALEKNYKKKHLVISMMILSLIKSNIPDLMVQALNCIGGFCVNLLRNHQNDLSVLKIAKQKNIVIICLYGLIFPWRQ